MIFLDKLKVLFNEGLDTTYQYVVAKYKQAKQTLTPASPYMQIITVLYNISQFVYLYLSTAITERDINKAIKPSSIYGLSRLVGHNPTRFRAAKGEFKIKCNVNAQYDVSADYIVFPTTVKLRCLNNDLIYTLLFQSERTLLRKNSYEYIYPQVLQGEFFEQQFVSDGEPLQSFNIKSARDGNIDNDYIYVYVNNVRFTVYEFMYDIPYNGNGCVIMTGINGGIDIYFGNTNFGTIPVVGSLIKVVYLETGGVSGNLYNNIDNVKFEFDDTIFDSANNEISPDDVLDFGLNQACVMGANAENAQFTKMIATGASLTNVLANANNYIYFLQKLNIFSFIDVYSINNIDFNADDQNIYLFLIPDIKRKLQFDNYFTLPTDDFTLTDYEKENLLTLIRNSGKQQISTELVIVQPDVKRYVLNVVVRVYEGYDDISLKSNIVTTLSDYFATIQRRDKIPRSDITRLVENVEYVDSVYTEFISEENESAKINSFYFVETNVNGVLQQQKVLLQPNENPNIGLDAFGDIIIGQNELAIIRGGFNDANGNFYDEYYNDSSLSNLNIIISEVIPNDLHNQIIVNKLNQLR